MDGESVSSEQSSHDAERSREASSVGESDSASTGGERSDTLVKPHLPAGKVHLTALAITSNIEQKQIIHN